MPRTGRTVDRPVDPRADLAPETPVGLLFAVGACWALIIILVSVVLAEGDPATARSQLIGSVSILAAIVFALVCCVLAARRRTAARLGWILMSVGLALGAFGQLAWVATAVSNTRTAPSALGDTLAFLGYFLPTVLAVLAFPRRSELLISRFRQALDVIVISIGVLLISEATVLGQVILRTDLTTLAGWLHLAYLVADVLICSLILCLGMRQLPGDRLTWLFLGTGLLVVSISDSIYVRLLTDGFEYAIATPLVAGWMLGPVLIGMATFIPMTGRLHRGRDYALSLQLLPYLPVVGALVLLGLGVGTRDPYFLVTAGLLLVAVMCRQVMIVYENVSLTRDLEGKVASRTSELTALGSIVTSSSDAIVGVSRDNRITAWNPAAERLYGYSVDRVIDEAPDFLLTETGTTAVELLERADRGDRLDGYEIDWCRPDGSVVPVAMTVSPIVGADGVQGISIFAQDITGRRREAEALERAREEALATARLKSEFLATMSHEIRTPMNAVIGLTSLLLETDLDPTQRTYAEGVQSAGDALLGVIDDILDFSKLEAGKVVLYQSDFSPRQLIEEVGALMAPAASAKGLELIVYCLPEVPAAVHGDVGRIRQILLNLASNAVKFTPVGEVIIKVEAPSVDRDRTRLRFEVVDTGIGIAEKDQGRLFQSFSQADASTTRRFGGTGLGLAISRRLVEVMGGAISLESEVDVGSRFTVELTLRTATRVEPALEAFNHDLLVDLRVLVVDDNTTNRTLLETQLAGWSMRPDAADSAQSAFEKLRSSALAGHPYDLAALDAQMPGVDGLELARRITADPVLRGLPMIMLTSGLYPEPGTMREVGITQWLPKPVRNAELFDRLIRLMAPREKELQRRRRHLELARPTSTTGGAVLVVDADPVSRVVARRLLAGLGLDVRCASDGQEALAALAESAFSTVLLDLDQSVVDGLETARAIRNLDGSGGRTPIVAALAYPSTEERERCLAAGIERLVYRPLDSASLESTLVDLMPVTPTTDGARTSHDPQVAAESRVIDPSRLEDLAELVSADGTSLVVSMVGSYVRRSAERAEALRRAVAADDREAVVAIAHELKGSSGTIGAQRVMQHASAIEQRARSGSVPSTDSVAELLAEMDAAVHELTVLVGPSDDDPADQPADDPADQPADDAVIR
jgi:two-component system sensor histidine kinase/response regulator